MLLGHLLQHTSVSLRTTTSSKELLKKQVTKRPKSIRKVCKDYEETIYRERYTNDPSTYKKMLVFNFCPPIPFLII